MLIINTPPIHLTYCMNIHAAESLDDIDENIFTKAVSVFSAVGNETGREPPYGLGLWFSRAVLKQLAESDYILDLKKRLRDNGLYVFTLNGFPYGEFHNTRVKEQVYSPDWSTRERFDYTRNLAGLLADLIDDGSEGTISTVPVTFKPWADSDTVARSAAFISDLAVFCDMLLHDTGKCIRLALEPEPGCFLETTGDCISFFSEQLYNHGSQYLEEEYSLSASRAQHIIRSHTGVCIDTVHSAVMYEDPAESIVQLKKQDIGICKIQLGAAVGLEVSEPEDAKALEQFADEVYLHQVHVRERSGKTHFFNDLPEALKNPVPGEWRVHFHIPLSGSYSSVPYTAVSQVDEDLLQAAVKAGISHFEVETYTLNLLPGFSGMIEQAMAHELEWVASRFPKLP